MNKLTTLTDRLIAHAHRDHTGRIPSATLDRARWVMLDTLVTAIGGLRHPELTQCLQALELGEAGPAQVWGTRHRATPDKAAFVNAFLVHNNEYDPLHERAVVHVPATVLPALLACAQGEPAVSGSRLLSAFCVGVDVAVTIGLAHGAPMRFFRPAMAGALGAAAGIAHLLRFDEDATRRAMSLTASQVSGTLQAHTEGTSTLAWQMGVNARGAIVASAFARAGMSAPRDFLQGAYGYLASYDGEAREEVDGAQLGERWAIDELSHKPYPSGRATHAAIDAVRAIRSVERIDPDRVAEIQVVVPPLVWHLAARPVVPEMTPNYARLCLPYAVAIACLRGSVRLEDFQGAAFHAPEVQALAHKVRPILDSDADHGALSPVAVRVRFADGRQMAQTIEAMRGSPAVPFLPDDMRDKAEQCLTSLPGDPRQHLRRLSDAIHALDDGPAAPVLADGLALC